MELTDPGQLLSLHEVATELAQSVDSVRRKIMKGELPHYRLGDGPSAPIKVAKTDLQTYLNKHYFGVAKKASRAKSRTTNNRKPTSV